MIHSVDHFLTTHVGSLPRPEELIQIMYSKEEGKPVDRSLLAAQVRAAVAAVVAKQRKSGIAIVSDGEMSKPSYATYIKDRLAGFGGTGNTFVYQDLVDFPNLAKRVFSDPGRSRRKTQHATDRLLSRTPELSEPMSKTFVRPWEMKSPATRSSRPHRRA